MKICMICEGSYPFVAGGVSSWLQQLIQNMPQHEFVIWAIGAQEKQRNHFAYQLPENVVSFQDVYLDSVLRERIAESPRRIHLSAAQVHASRELLSCQNPDWNELFNLFRGNRLKGVEFLLDRDFFSILQEICAKNSRMSVSLIFSGPFVRCSCRCYT